MRSDGNGHDPGGLTGKTALVTGGTRGIGRAIVEALAGDGCRVLFCARNEAAVDELAGELSGRGHTVRGVVADVTRKDQVAPLVDAALALSEHGGIDILVNNAGRSGGGPTVDLSDEIWEGVIETNLNSLFRVTREVLQRGGMLARGWGRIINIASTGGKQGVVLAAPYSAAKHGVVGFSKALGLELARTGVTVNAVCPGFVETGLARHVRENYSKAWGCTVDEAKARIEQRIPTGRYVQPGEVAEMVRFLAAPVNLSITAQAINVCGGLGNY
jgi:ketoreductase